MMKYLITDMLKIFRKISKACIAWGFVNKTKTRY